tara:strand:+ start:109 stop:1398 length:1290 start_codon:yes stop_codon:yes gene_type:complete
MNKKYFFSIIIPIFNSEKFLKKSINSILNEDNKQLEIILINDFSKDKSLKICKNFKRKYKNIVLINNKKNLGAGKCRNIGIKKAKGNYIIFLDSDDYIFKNSINKIQEEIIKNNFPSAILHNVSKNNKEKNLFLKFFKKDIYSKNLFIKKLLKHKIIVNECWNLIIKNNLELRKIKFLDIRIAEDNGYVMDIFFSMKNILINKSLFIFHTTRIESARHLVGFESAYSYLMLILKYINLIKKFKKKHVYVKYIKFRIIITIDYLKAYLYLLNKKDTNQFFSLKKLKHLKNYSLSKSDGVYRNLSIIKNIKLIESFKEKFEKQLYKIFLIQKKTGNKINIICADLLAKTVIKYFYKKNIKINKIIDEDFNMDGKLFMKYKIHLFKKLKQRDFNNSLNLVCHQNKKVQDMFINKFKNLRIDLKNVFCIRIFK